MDVETRFRYLHLVSQEAHREAFSYADGMTIVPSNTPNCETCIFNMLLMHLVVVNVISKHIEELLINNYVLYYTLRI